MVHLTLPQSFIMFEIFDLFIQLNMRKPKLWMRPVIVPIILEHFQFTPPEWNLWRLLKLLLRIQFFYMYIIQPQFVQEETSLISLTNTYNCTTVQFVGTPRKSIMLKTQAHLWHIGSFTYKIYFSETHWIQHRQFIMEFQIIPFSTLPKISKTSMKVHAINTERKKIDLFDIKHGIFNFADWQSFNIWLEKLI